MMMMTMIRAVGSRVSGASGDGAQARSSFGESSKLSLLDSMRGSCPLDRSRICREHDWSPKKA